MTNQFANNEVIQRLNNRWQTLPRNRQRVILLAFAALAIGFFWAFVYQPIQASRIANTASIKQLNISLNEMRSDVVQLNELSKLTKVDALNPSAKADEKIVKQNADVAALENIFGANSKVVRLQNGQFQITTANIQYVDWLAKTDVAVNRYRLEIASANLARIAGGVVNTTLILKAAP